MSHMMHTHTHTHTCTNICLLHTHTHTHTHTHKTEGDRERKRLSANQQLFIGSSTTTTSKYFPRLHLPRLCVLFYLTDATLPARNFSTPTNERACFHFQLQKCTLRRHMCSHNTLSQFTVVHKTLLCIALI